MKAAFLCTVALVLLSMGTSRAAVPGRSIDRAMNAAIASGREVGITLAVERGNTLIYERAYGMRDKARRLPATVDTRYEIGSVTKEMTAAAVMQLVEAGRVSLDAPLSRYVPDAPHAAEVTIRQLLSMTSGMPEYLNGANLLNEVQHPASPAQLLARVSAKELRFKPGSQWQHSNTNYLLLGELIERVSGEAYQRYIGDRVLSKAPGAAFVTLNNEIDLPEMATGYFNGAAAPHLDNSWVGPAGNLVGTVHDMIAWDRALSGGNVVSQASYSAMTSTQTPPGASARYGFAFFLSAYRNQPRIWQDGSTIGFNVCDQYYPKQDVRVVVFTNSNDMTGYADTLAEQVFDLLYPVP
jgi:D-alanyl-D-alanine carboxypeptidase